MTDRIADTGLERLARPSGGFAMVALDQRESLRMMLAEQGVPAADADLTAFKLDAAQALGADASGLLIDRHYGYQQLVAAQPLPPSCGLILAFDALQQAPGAPVEDTDLDPEIGPARARDQGAVALKLLVIWRRDARRAARHETAARFVAACRDAGLCSVLEGVVKPAAGETRFDLDEAIVEAAEELGGLRPSIYKAQVPGRGEADDNHVTAVCQELTARLPVPWVVLSQGVPQALFPRAVELACRAGASGFLAGRAVWSDTLGEPAALLRQRSVPRLRGLAATVDQHARPWWDVAR
ncbi:MAG: hypothetical protein ACRDTQ_14120 [Micromonosporaceae bacterium]